MKAPWGAALLLIIASGMTCTEAVAAPIWLEAGDVQLKSDVETLADAGVIVGPVDAWPIPADAIVNDLTHASPDALPSDAVAAWTRLRNLLSSPDACEPSSLEVHAAVQAGKPALRWFEDAPRGRVSAAVMAQRRCGRTFFGIDAGYVFTPQDQRRRARLDGSYVGSNLGNWLLSAGAKDQWWGSPWSGAMLLSTDARPFPSLGLMRAQAEPFQSPWLSWIGPWSLTTFMGVLEHDSYIPDAKIWGLRLSARPNPRLQVAFYRTALWGGQGLDNSLTQFWSVVAGGNAHDDPKDPGSVAGSQLAGIDVRYSFHLGGAAMAAYVNGGFRDETHHIPKKFFPLFGLETHRQAQEGDEYRLFIEYADTTAGWPFSNGIPVNNTYENSQYRNGYRYLGSPIGYPTDNDSRTLTVGDICAGQDGVVTTMMLRGGVLNHDGTNAPPPGGNVIAASRTPMIDANWSWTKSIAWGLLSVALDAGERWPEQRNREYSAQIWVQWSRGL